MVGALRLSARVGPFRKHPFLLTSPPPVSEARAKTLGVRLRHPRSFAAKKEQRDSSRQDISSTYFLLVILGICYRQVDFLAVLVYSIKLSLHEALSCGMLFGRNPPRPFLELYRRAYLSPRSSPKRHQRSCGLERSFSPLSVDPRTRTRVCLCTVLRVNFGWR